MYNLTVIGNPGTGSGANGGDEATAWRDNTNMQIRQSVFMNFGQALVRNENQASTTAGSADLAGGYGANGTLGFIPRWTTAYTYMTTGTGPNSPSNPATFYRAQTNGTLCEMSDTVAFGFPNTSTYTNYPAVGSVPAGQSYSYPYGEADAVGFSLKANRNVKATLSPIVSITRGSAVTVGSTAIVPVTGLDPRAANDAVTANPKFAAPNDGFFTPVGYRGAFSSSQVWVCDWTAADAFGLITTPHTTGCETFVACPADLNGDGTVGANDLATLLAAWGGTGSGDISGNGTIGAEDLAALLAAWGICQ
jgi:hypothetical protein